MICQPNKSQSKAKVFVVDARPGDYSGLIETAARDQMELKFFPSGRDALRTNPDDTPEMWIINMHLPDMSGTDLYSMLQARGCSAPVALVGDAYSAEEEINARISGATLYFAKPLQGECLMAAAH